MFKKSLLIILIMAFASGKADKAATGKAVNTFAVELYHTLIEENEDNVFFSPYSIYTALGMTYGGAVAETKEEFERVLAMTATGEDFHAALKDLNSSLVSVPAGGLKKLFGKETYQFQVANAVWVQPDFPIRDDYLRLTKTFYDSEAKNSISAEGINRWVAKNTNDKITKLVTAQDVEGAVAVLTNATYFLGFWEQAFAKKDTRDAPFYSFDASESVPLMFQTEEINYVENEHVKAVELDYRDSDIAMMLILPKETGQAAFASLEEDLSEATIKSLTEAMSVKEVQLYVPRFKLEIGSSLLEPLRSLGLERAITASAQFCDLTEACNVHIKDVIHKAFIKVDEEGTEAAAATAVIMVETAAVVTDSKTFRADRPFIYLIRDKKSGSILFMGRMLKPAS